MLKQKTGKGLRIISPHTTLEMGRRRMDWLFDEFDNIMVSVSGGKDSTVLLELALETARKKNRLPLPVYWLDQEAEWQGTVDICSDWFTREEIEPLWLQVPFRIFNATSATEHWLNAWEPGKEDEWCHPQHPVSIKENMFGTDRFYKLFYAVLKWRFGAKARCCSLSGVRAEEAPTRRLGLTSFLTYKWVTWGGVHHPKYHQYMFCPIYDWSYIDIWKAIHEHGWAYNRIYDAMWQRGGQPMKMRVSNLHHEQAVSSLFSLQELEPETYERLVNRIEGIHMAATLGSKQYGVGPTLPFMFETWREYRDYLLEKLIDPEHQAYMRHMFYMDDRRTPPGQWSDFIHGAQCNCIMANDVEGKCLDHHRRNFEFIQAQKAYVATLGPDPFAGSPKPPPVPASVSGVVGPGGEGAG